MEAFIPQVADASSNLLAARNQMGFTLGFHIVLACFGVAFPLMMLIAEYRGRKRNDEAALRLARNWSKAVAVLFAVGAVSGTVLSFEFGLLWPRFMDSFGDVSNVKPLEVLTNSAAGYEFLHMLLAAYMVAGFLLASVYAVGMLRG